MRNNFLKTITMIGALIILSAVSGRAQAGAGFTVVVPFDFTVSGKVLPAGEYIVARSQPFNEGFMIRAKDGSAGAFLQTMPVQTIENQAQTKVVFKRYGEASIFFLRSGFRDATRGVNCTSRVRNELWSANWRRAPLSLKPSP